MDEILTAFELLTALLIGGVMGLVGQGARTIVGLKKMNDEAAQKQPSEQDVFVASRLVVSLFIGFVAGVFGAIALGLDKLKEVQDLTILLGLAAAGYTGADAIEGFASRYLPGKKSDSAEPQKSLDDEGAAQEGEGGAIVPPPTDQTEELKTTLSAIGAGVTEIKDHLGLAIRSVAPAIAPGTASLPATPEMVKKLFPATPIANIRRHLPSVLAGLEWAGLADTQMLLMALATIRAETEGFVPISEWQSKYNTATTPFDLYDAGTKKGKVLGNTEPGDGPKFKGRGFVQLTGRDNYTRIGRQLGANLVEEPDLANDAELASKILAQFLLNKEDEIRSALLQGDLKQARKLVNGGQHGFERFADAYVRGRAVFPIGESLVA